MNIEYRQTSTIKRYYNNAKEHPDAQVKEIAKSIERFGFRQPIVVDQNNVVVIGHGRLLAAKKLGLREVPVTVVDDLSEAEVNALRLVDNKLNESAWDFSALEAELASIDGIDMSDFGFTPISETDIEYITRQPEMPIDRGERIDDVKYSPIQPDGVNGRVSASNDARGGNKANGHDSGRTHIPDAVEGGYEDERGRRLVGERGLTEAEGGHEYRYICPRCKHRFN